MYYFHKLLRNVKKNFFKDLEIAPLNPNRDLLIYSQMPSSGHTLKRPVPSRGPPSPPSHSQDSMGVSLAFREAGLPAGMARSLDLLTSLFLLPMHLHLYCLLHGIKRRTKNGGIRGDFKTFFFKLSISSKFSVI